VTAATRACARCGLVKPLTEEHYTLTRARNGGGGVNWRSICRECDRQRIRDQRHLRSDRLDSTRPPAQPKACKMCGVVKPPSEFYASRDRLDGLQAACKPCQQAQARVARQARLERGQGPVRSETMAYRKERAIAKPAKRLRAPSPAATTPIPHPVGRHQAGWFSAIQAVQDYWRLLRDSGGLGTVASGWTHEARVRHLAALDEMVNLLIKQREALADLDANPPALPDNVRHLRPG
jgi:hypothetical protein